MSKPKAARAAAANPTNLLDVEQLIEAIKKQKSYKGTQQNLYSYARTGWSFYEGQLEPFGLYSQAYTASTGKDAIQFITDTEAMPSYEALRGGYALTPVLLRR